MVGGGGGGGCPQFVIQSNIYIYIYEIGIRLIKRQNDTIHV